MGGSSETEEIEEPEGLDSDDEAFDQDAQALRWARERGLRALEATRGTPVGAADWGEILLPAARQLLKALSSVAESDRLWKAVQDSTAQLQMRDDRSVQAILDQDLAALLVYMGFRPPPRPQRLELELKDALADVLEARGGASFEVARRAQQNLAFFTIRLRRVIDEVEEIYPSKEVLNKQPQDDRRWRRLRAAVVKGTIVVVPAALAAGLVALVFPPAAPVAAPAAAGFTVAVTAAGQEALKQGTQVAATGLLEKMTADEPALATVGDQHTMAQKRVRIAMLDLRSVLSKAAAQVQNPQHVDVLVDVYALEAISALYGFLDAEVRCSSGSRQALPAAVDEALNLLNRIRDVVRSPSRWGEWSQLAGRLRNVERNLAEVVGAGGRPPWIP